MLIFQRVLLIATFAMWFGGFGFYASVVVPIGTDILGAAIEQGAITQRVTVWINILSGVALIAMAIESATRWKQMKPTTRWIMLGINLGIAGCLTALIYLHPILDGMFDSSELLIRDSKQFYRFHQAYLWTSTLQWLLGWAWLAVLISSWTWQATKPSSD